MKRGIKSQAGGAVVLSGGDARALKTALEAAVEAMSNDEMPTEFATGIVRMPASLLSSSVCASIVHNYPGLLGALDSSLVNEEVCRAAVNRCPESLALLPEEKHSDSLYLLHVIVHRTLSGIPEHKISAEHCRIMVEYDFESIGLVPDRFVRDPTVREALIESTDQLKSSRHISAVARPDLNENVKYALRLMAAERPREFTKACFDSYPTLKEIGDALLGDLNEVASVFGAAIPRAVDLRQLALAYVVLMCECDSHSSVVCDMLTRDHVSLSEASKLSIYAGSKLERLLAERGYSCLAESSVAL